MVSNPVPLTFFETRSPDLRPISGLRQYRSIISRLMSALAAGFVLHFSGADAAAASVELADGKTLQGALSCTPTGKLSLTGTNGEKREISWADVRLARFSEAPPNSNPLPRGWAPEEIGRVSASSAEKDGAFTLSVAGAELREKKFQPLFFARRLVRGEPIVTARITEFTGEKPAIGGVMMRENLELPAGYALLGVTADKKLKFEIREGGWNPVRQQDLGAVKLPIWLRLFRAEKENAVTAYKSSDGQQWEQVAQSKLNAMSEPYPESSDQWRPRLYAGVGVTAPATNAAPAVLQCDNAVISVRGLLGEYFSDTKLTKAAFARPDRQLEFWFGDRSPAPILDPDEFSIRWTGQVEPRFTENYRFYFEDGSRLWLNGEEVTGSPWSENRRGNGEGKEVPLTAGKKYDVRFEFIRSRETRAARLGWANRSQPREVIPTTAMLYTYPADSPGEETESTGALLATGVWLRSGSFLAGEITTADSSSTDIALANANGKPLRVLNNRIARVMLRATRQPIRFELADGRTGTFLRGGDFMECELQQIDTRTVVVTSLLFGRRSYSRESSQGALAVVFNPLGSMSAPLEVTLNNRSVIRARALRTDGATAVIEEVTLGEVRVPLPELQQVRTTTVGAQAKAQ
jgi:hypothetical protein